MSRAVSLFKTAVRLDPHFPLAYLQLADLYLALALEREAERAARECLTRSVAAGDQGCAAAALGFLSSLRRPCDPH